MDQVHVIRHKHYIEKMGIRAIAREMGIDRKSVRKYLEEPEPKRKACVPRARPVMEEVGPRIDELLEEWKPRTTKKQRVTSPRVHRQLLAEGHQVGERTVREYLAEKRRQRAEVYVPLVHRPGDDAQVDFFEVTVEEDGVMRKAWKLLVRLMHSGRDFVQIYDRCDQLAFLDGHVRAFAYFGGVPRRMVYDNLSAAVKRRAGMFRERELTDAFRALVSYHLFEACFARVGEGHDKGGVESRGKGIRLQHMTPIPQGVDLQSISSTVMADIESLAAQRPRRDGQSTEELFEADKRALMPLPEVPYEARKPRAISISRSSTTTIEGVLYSLPERWARLDAMAYVGACDIRFVCRGEEIYRERVLRPGRMIIYRDYLGELSRKPQAVRQVAPELVAELGEPYGGLWAVLERTHGAQKGAGVLAGVLGAIHEHGEEMVTTALSTALAQGRTDLLDIRRHLPEQAPILEGQLPAQLRDVHVEAGRASDYDYLLIGGVQ
jgi:transposase